jgi:hypothetical protein
MLNDPELSRALALRAIKSQLLRLKWLVAAERFEIAMRRHDRALRRACKANFNPDQPRVPRGQREGGQWIDDGGSSGKIRLAGEIPTGDSPKIPKVRPPISAARTAVLKQVARRLGPAMTIGELAFEAGHWIYEYQAKINSYNDPPKSLEELQNAVSDVSQAGYQDHHIVEQTSAEKDGGFSRELIDSPDNVVRIPTMKHEDINGWSQRPSPAYDLTPPREYLRDKSWEERREVGLQALIENKVLKP